LVYFKVVIIQQLTSVILTSSRYFFQALVAENTDDIPKLPQGAGFRVRPAGSVQGK